MNENIISFFRQNGLQLTLQTITAIIFILNLFLTTKLAPLAQNLDALSTKVSALEVTVTNQQDDHVDIQVIKSQVSEIKDDVKDMKADLKIISRNTQ